MRAARLRLALTALSVVAVVALGAVGFAGAASAASPYAPIDAPGPKLTVSAAKLKASLRCTSGVRHATREPVLLLPGTTLNSTEDFGFGYEPLLARTGIPYCTSDSVDDPQNMQDIQVRGQYVTYAIRAVHALAGRRIAVLGHSQGGMVMRWSLRFWPDTRAMVDDVIGLAASNHGTIDADALCLATCSGGIWQQRTNSAFLAALNSGQETFPGISYTEVYTHTDEVVQPNLDDTGSTALHGGGGAITNVAVQDVCPLDLPDHLLVGTADPVAAALALDALTHAGPASVKRVGTAPCGRQFLPGLDPVTAAAGLARVGAEAGAQVALAPHTAAEPPLACYVTATCRG